MVRGPTVLSPAKLQCLHQEVEFHKYQRTIWRRTWEEHPSPHTSCQSSPERHQRSQRTAQTSGTTVSLHSGTEHLSNSEGSRTSGLQSWSSVFRKRRQTRPDTSEAKQTVLVNPAILHEYNLWELVIPPKPSGLMKPWKPCSSLTAIFSFMITPSARTMEEVGSVWTGEHSVFGTLFETCF